MDKYKNKDGTYNGVNMLSDLSGLSKEEIKWTAERMNELLNKENKSKREAIEIIKEEQKQKPWLNNVPKT